MCSTGRVVQGGGRFEPLDPKSEKPTYAICTDRVVLQPLAHLLAICRQHQAVADQVLEGRLVEEGGGQHHQGVEPAAGLRWLISSGLGGKVG